VLSEIARTLGAPAQSQVRRTGEKTIDALAEADRRELVVVAQEVRAKGDVDAIDGEMKFSRAIRSPGRAEDATAKPAEATSAPAKHAIFCSADAPRR
jgi:hypothetical protein